MFYCIFGIKIDLFQATCSLMKRLPYEVFVNNYQGAGNFISFKILQTMLKNFFEHILFHYLHNLC